LATANPPIRVQEVARGMVEEGVPVTAICESLGISRRRYYAWRAAGKWPSRELKTLDDSVRREAFSLLDTGLSMGAVSRKLGVHRKTISRWRRSRPVAHWRCYCTPFGILVEGLRCPKCSTPAPWVANKEKGSNPT
jgi:transposase-like protein